MEFLTGFVRSGITIVIFFAMLGLLVVIHELGHFVVARLAGVRVLEFGLGFPPRAKVLSAKGDTLITLNWLPLGGFVRLEGEDGDATDDPRSFAAKPLRVRLAILVAGVGMNIALAFVLFFLIALLATPVFGVRVGEIEPQSPAQAAGIAVGDEIFSVAGERFDLFGGRSVQQALRGHAGQAVEIGVRHADGTQTTVSATLRPAADTSPTRGALGVGQLEQTYEYVGHDIGTSAGIAVGELGRWGGLIIGGLGQLIDGLIKDPTAPPPASGPIGIAVSLADIFLNVGPIVTLYVAGILSVNLGVVNILPFPPLDGGRSAVMIIKRLFGARVSLRAERFTYAVGFVFLLAFILWISGFDIARLGGGSP